MVGVPDKGGGPVVAPGEVPQFFWLDDQIIRVDSAGEGVVGAWDMVSGAQVPIMKPLTVGTPITEADAVRLAEEEKTRRAESR
jgi:hypothetical protein